MLGRLFGTAKEEEKPQTLTTGLNPFDNDDADSSPGASDNDDSDTEEDRQQAEAKRKKADEDLHGQLDALNVEVDHQDEELKTDNNQKVAVRRSAFTFEGMTQTMKATLGFGAAATSKSAELSPVTAKPPTPPKAKTPQELETERRQKLWERQQAAEEEMRQEQLRLAHEPEIAKVLRKAFADANTVSVLLNDVFNGRRFGNIRNTPDTESVSSLLHEEMSFDNEKILSINLFVKWKSENSNMSLQLGGNFDVLSSWISRITELSHLWHEVFRYYAIAEGENYPFSLQPLEKLRYFFEELNNLTIVERQFDAYMKRVSADESQSVLEAKQENLKQFIATINLFSARSMMLYKLLDGLKTQMERAEKMQRQLRGISEMALPDEIDFTVVDDDEEANEVSEKPEWMLRLDAAVEAATIKTRAMTGYEAQLGHYQKGTEEYNEVDRALRVLETEWVSVKRELEAAQQAANREANIWAAAKEEAKKERAAKKAAEKADIEEEKAQRREAEQARRSLIEEASRAATQFLIGYAAQSESALALTLSQTIQAVLPIVSTEMLKLWLSDQTERLSSEDAEWLSTFIAPELRELTCRLVFSPNIAFLLEDIQGEMLEVVSIHLDGSVRGSLVSRGNDSLTHRTANDYVLEVNAAAENILTIKAASSSVSERAVALLREIAQTRVEYNAHTHADLKHMNEKTFALFGVYLLLYLQDAPKHNFANIDVYNDAGSSASLGAGSRFLRHLMKNVQRELGYHLRHCKVIYDAMNARVVTSAKKEMVTTPTTRSSLMGLTSASAVCVDENVSSKFSEDLEYIFNLTRTVTELEKPAIEARKMLSVKDNKIAQDILVRELTGRYLSSPNESFSSLYALMMEKNLSEVDRKRMKRIVKLMDQLPYEKRRPLMGSPIVQLFVLREQVEAYKRSSTGQKRSSFSSAITGAGRSLLKATGVDRKEDKFKFFVEVFAYLKAKFIGASENAPTSEKDAFSTSMFIIDFYEEITHKDECENVGEWVIKNILEGQYKESLTRLMWLPNDVLDDVFLGSGIGAKTIREMNGTSEAAFSDAHDSGSNSVDETVIVNAAIGSANELMMVLAVQAAVLSFDRHMLSTKNETLIVMASQHSWFLQLRFWEIIMVENGILSPIVQGHTAAQNRRLERNTLKIIDNMIENIVELAMSDDPEYPDAITSYFSQTDSKTLHDTIVRMPVLQKVVLAFVLVSGFLAIHYEKLASIKTAASADKAVWKKLANYFWHILAMTDFTLNENDKAMFFAIVVNFLFANPALLADSRIEGCLLEDTSRLLAQPGQTQCVIPNTGDSSFDTSFFASSAKSTLVQDSAAVEKGRLSTTKAAYFVDSAANTKNPIKDVVLQDALSRLGYKA